jgi:hypothetical protein
VIILSQARAQKRLTATLSVSAKHVTVLCADKNAVGLLPGVIPRASKIFSGAPDDASRRSPEEQ